MKTGWATGAMVALAFFVTMAITLGMLFATREVHAKNEVTGTTAMNQKIFNLIDSLKTAADINRQNFETQTRLISNNTYNYPVKHTLRRVFIYHQRMSEMPDWGYTFSSMDFGYIDVDIGRYAAASDTPPTNCALDYYAIVTRLQAAEYAGRRVYIHALPGNRWIFEKERIRIEVVYYDVLVVHNQRRQCVRNITIESMENGHAQIV